MTMCAAGFGGAPAEAQTQYPIAIPAVVVRVIDGDTLRARLEDGRIVTVRLIGIDAPEVRGPVECAGKRASDHLERLVEGRNVLLQSDPTQGQVDRFGRSLFYVDRRDGVDAGLAMLRAGWAEVFVVNNQDFERYDTYADAENKSSGSGRGAATATFTARGASSSGRGGGRRRHSSVATTRTSHSESS